MNLCQFDCNDYALNCYINEHRLYCYDLWCLKSKNMIDHGFYDTLTGCQRRVFEIVKDIMAEQIGKEYHHEPTRIEHVTIIEQDASRA